MKKIIKSVVPPSIWDGLKLFRQKGGLLFFKFKIWMVNRLAQKMDYEFSVDYVSAVAPLWMEHLKEFQGKPNLKMLEIGCFEGRSTIWFLKNIITNPTSFIICVDTFGRYGGEYRFDHNIKISGRRNQVKKLRGRSEEILQTLSKERLDIVYIDGCHQAMNVLMDALNTWVMLRSEGILIFDDYQWEPHLPPVDRPQMAIDLFLTAFQPHIQLLHKGNQVILRKIPA